MLPPDGSARSQDYRALSRVGILLPDASTIPAGVLPEGMASSRGAVDGAAADEAAAADEEDSFFEWSSTPSADRATKEELLKEARRASVPSLAPAHNTAPADEAPLAGAEADAQARPQDTQLGWLSREEDSAPKAAPPPIASPAAKSQNERLATLLSKVASEPRLTDTTPEEVAAALAENDDHVGKAFNVIKSRSAKRLLQPPSLSPPPSPPRSISCTHSGTSARPPKPVLPKGLPPRRSMEIVASSTTAADQAAVPHPSPFLSSVARPSPPPSPPAMDDPTAQAISSALDGAPSAVESASMAGIRLKAAGSAVSAAASLRTSPKVVELHAAAHRGDVNVLRSIIGDKSCSVDALDAEGRSALHQAVADGNLPAVIVLVEELKASPSILDHSGATPLDEAVYASHHVICEYLKSRGAVAGAGKKRPAGGLSEDSLVRRASTVQDAAKATEELERQRKAQARLLQQQLASCDLAAWEAELKAWLSEARRPVDGGFVQSSADGLGSEMPAGIASSGRPYGGRAGLHTIRSLLAATPEARASYLVQLCGGGALRGLRRRYARLVMYLVSKLPTTLSSQQLTESDEQIRTAKKAIALIHKVLQNTSTDKSPSAAGLPGLTPPPPAKPTIGSTHNLLELLSELETALPPHEVCVRYAHMLRELTVATQHAAVDSLFLGSIERCTTIVANFETLRYPVTAAFRFIAGHHLATLKRVIKTAKREWGNSKHPRDVLLAVLIEHAPPEMLVRCLSTYEQLERWWSDNVRVNDRAGSEKAMVKGFAATNKALLGPATSAASETRTPPELQVPDDHPPAKKKAGSLSKRITGLGSKRTSNKGSPK